MFVPGQTEFEGWIELGLAMGAAFGTEVSQQTELDLEELGLTLPGWQG